MSNTQRSARLPKARGVGLIGFLTLATLFVTTAQVFAVETWTRWEQSLTSTKAYENPYASIDLKVVYRGPAGQQISGLGFWDGSNTFKIRATFPAAGKWTWQTTCSDSNNVGLHLQTGSVEVTPYSGTSVLYRRGSFKVSQNQRHLCYSDGTPFLWIGDTAWAMPMNTSWTDWQSYVSDRVTKHFTVLQIFCASDWAGTNDWKGNPAFVGKGLNRINPAYWQQYEEKVQYANEHGLAVAIVGLMEPVSRYPERAEAQRFARHLVARLMGNFIILSPSFDSTYMELGDQVGQTIREASSVHLVLQHPGTDLPTAKAYHDKAYAQVSGLQSGAGWGTTPLSADTAAQNAVEWSQTLYRAEPIKPVINLEARYDSDFNDKQMPRLPRSCGYWSLLSGCAGYTYGCAGIWNWNIPVTHDDPQETVRDWRVGLNRPSSKDIKHMAEFFTGLKWWTLEPHSELIMNQANVWNKHMVFGKSADGKLAVAYLPDNNSVRLNLASFAEPISVRWFNPQTGQMVPVGASASHAGEFERPKGWEDALLTIESSGGR